MGGTKAAQPNIGWLPFLLVILSPPTPAFRICICLALPLPHLHLHLHLRIKHGALALRPSTCKKMGLQRVLKENVLLKGTASAVPKTSQAEGPTALPKAGAKPKGEATNLSLYFSGHRLLPSVTRFALGDRNCSPPQQRCLCRCSFSVCHHSAKPEMWRTACS
jgi:hypothetical protein